MEEEEKLSLSTALPQLIHQVEVNTKFKANLISSGVLNDDILDSLIEKNKGQNLIFKIVQHLKKANERDGLHRFLQVLRESGQHEASDTIQSELIKHTQRLNEVKRTREPERPDQLPTEARNSLAALQSEIAPTTRPGSTRIEPVARTLPTESLEEIRATLKEMLPGRGTRRQPGFVIVTRQYYLDVYDFVSTSAAAPPPGPLPQIDTSKSCHLIGTVGYLPPGPCAYLSRTFGGHVSLTYYIDEQHPVLRSRAAEVTYCHAIVVVDPGGITKCAAWLSAHTSLHESLSSCTIWPAIEGRSHTSNSSLDLSMSGMQWYPTSLSNAIRIARKGPSLEGLPKEEKQKILHDHVRMGQGDEEKTVVQSSYGQRALRFAAGATDEEPGPIQVLNSTVAAHRDTNVCNLPIEFCAALIDMYGGSATLVKGKEGSRSTLDDMDNNTVYVSSIVKLHTGRKIGGFYLAVERTIADAVADAMGGFPTRVQAEGGGIDLELDMTVRKWRDTSRKTNVLLIWA